MFHSYPGYTWNFFFWDWCSVVLVIVCAGTVTLPVLSSSFGYIIKLSSNIIKEDPIYLPDKPNFTVVYESISIL